ncbi:uncharacterized protein LTR77_000951 [Saxophila tyrrhenica]|uniref:Uncharacterized protein n=1 Tax=Saxophila tyrrhenica TaxID=1690608 RepID=A0AAV9PP69_9PEZI|nr:hypothetical protein LTR77_000951 [Saxophila tyrrhenica]
MENADIPMDEGDGIELGETDTDSLMDDDTHGETTDSTGMSFEAEDMEVGTAHTNFSLDDGTCEWFKAIVNPFDNVDFGDSWRRIPRPRLVDSIEKEAMKPVNIETFDTDDALALCHSQEQSLLFTALPREIRELVWKFATAPYEVEQKRYEENEYYCRPGHTAPLNTDFGLLLTCRRAWLEANAYPMLQAEQCYWYYREAPDRRDPDWMGSLTAMNRRNLGHLHIFPQMFTIEGLADRRTRPLRSHFPEWRVRLGEFQPRMLHVTVRHTDWWYWESDEPLRFKDSWFKTLLDTDELRSTHIIKLDLETLAYKVKQLMPIVERLSQLESEEFETHFVDGKPTPTKFVLHRDPEVQKWSGPANIDNENFTPYDGKEKLDYHIVTLTWRLHFPKYPRAHVPTLRRSPRVGVSEDPPRDPESDVVIEAHAQGDFPSLPQYEEHRPNRLPWRDRRLESRIKRKGLVELNDSRSLMISAAVYGQNNQRYRSEVHERLRKARFDLLMARVYEQSWREKWEKEGSLLKFGE